MAGSPFGYACSPVAYVRSPVLVFFKAWPKIKGCARSDRRRVQKQYDRGGDFCRTSVKTCNAG